LEFLEQRLTLSNVPVTTNLDSGPGSLRAAIATAAAGDTIVFDPSVHTITLTSGNELVVDKNLTIQGPGAGKLTISGNNMTRVFDITNSATVTITGLTIANGQSTGQLPSSMVGQYEYSTSPPLYSGAGGGGGILNEFGSTLTLRNDTISGNRAVGAVGFTVLGGGLFNLGTATISACTFSNNQATGGGALDNIGGSAGGGIENFGGPNGGSTLKVSNTTFSNNSAVAAGGGYYFGMGGAVENDAGLNSFTPGMAEGSSAVYTHCTFVNNLATGGADAIGEGGAIINQGIKATMTLVNCKIDANRAIGGGGGNANLGLGDSEGIAGGISNGGGSTMTITGSAITNNLAQAGDNAVLSDGDPGASGAFGGGIQNNLNSVLNISNTTIEGNTAKGGNMTTLPGPGGDAQGGGIDNSSAGIIPGVQANLLTMSDCTVTNNSALAGNGGAGTNSNLVNAQGGFAFGGGVDTSHNSSSTVITGCTISENRAVGGAGGSGNAGSTAYGGGLAVGYGSLWGQADSSQLTVIRTTVNRNQAIGGTGASTGVDLGGGLAINPGSSATVSDGTFSQNVATGSQTSSGQAIGGGGIENQGKLTLIDSHVTYNQAVTTAGSDVLGGGLLNNQGQATIDSSTFRGNQALGGGSGSFFSGSAGGAIDNYEGGSLIISNSSFANNQAISAADAPGDFFYATGGAIEEDAGIINNNPSTATITNSSFTNNLATGGAGVDGNGGGIDIQSNNTSTPGLVTMTLIGCKITGNRSVGGGGGDGVTSGDSEGVGGGLMSVRGTLNVTNCEISNNQAIGGNGATISAADPYAGGGYGGGISNNDSGFGGGTQTNGGYSNNIAALTILNSTISGNIVRGGNNSAGLGGNAFGGGISNSPQATMTLTDTCVVGNRAIGGSGSVTSAAGIEGGLGFGGGIDTSNDGSISTLTNCTITCNSATGGAGANGGAGGNGDGGGLGVGWGTLVGLATDGSSLRLIDSRVADNQATGGAGGAGANGGDGQGGGLFIGPTATATLTDSKIVYNTANGGAAGGGGSVGQGIGGGVYNDAGAAGLTKDLLTAIDHNFASFSNDNIYP